MFFVNIIAFFEFSLLVRLIFLQARWMLL